jgi:hypothetical protein
MYLGALDLSFTHLALALFFFLNGAWHITHGSYIYLRSDLPAGCSLPSIDLLIMPNFSFLLFLAFMLLPSPHRTGRDSDTMLPLYMRAQNVEVTKFSDAGAKAQIRNL